MALVGFEGQIRLEVDKYYFHPHRIYRTHQPTHSPIKSTLPHVDEVSGEVANATERINLHSQEYGVK